jgi:predicted nucleic acid-binding protein
MTRVLLDTGPLVSLIDRSDAHHEWTCMQFAALRPPLYTCEAVIAEAVYLLAGAASDATAPLDLMARGVLAIDFDLSAEHTAVRALLGRYAPKMDLADACLVRMSELARDCRVITLDGDFRVYRRHGRQVVPAIMPDTPLGRRARRSRRRAHRPRPASD